MDPFTHGLSGTLLAVFFSLRPRYGLVAAAALVVASMAPDLDALPIILGLKYFYQYHRVLFHSLAGALPLVVGLSTAVYLFTPLKDYRLVLTLSLAGVLLHLVVDLLSSWGIPLLYPLSTHRYSLDLVWFVNLIIVVVALGALLWVRTDLKNAPIIAGVALALIGVYVGFRWYQQRTVVDFMRNEVLSENSPALVGVIPSQMRFFTWHAVVQQNDGYLVHDVHFCLAPREVRTLSGGAGGTRILSSQTIHSSSEKDIIAASKEAELARIFLERARFPVALVEKREKGYRVDWQDVHLMLAGGGIRGVIVYTDEQGRVTGQRFKLKPELEMLERKQD
ncbi:MAG: metal-dependent hydrolase [Chloroflexota bacterium]